VTARLLAIVALAAGAMTQPEAWLCWPGKALVGRQAKAYAAKR
jgi:hypothetical protein